MSSIETRITQEPQEPEAGESFVVHIDGTANHPYFSFFIQSGAWAGHVDVKPDSSIADWRKALSPEEKVNVMHRILATYRMRSRNESGFKVAALGVSESGDLYISYNGSYNSSRQMRQCAELKMAARAEECETGRDEPVKFAELYVEGAGPGAHIAGLCGDCTNLMSKLMHPQSPIYVLPGGDGKSWLKLDSTAEAIGDVQSGRAWVTNMAHLRKHRQIKLNDTQKDIQIEGVASLARDISDWVDRPVEEDPNVVVKTALTLSPMLAKASRLSKFHLPLDRLNEYMREQIYLTVADRLEEIASEKRGLGHLKDLNPPQVEQLVKEEIQWARCAVMQRDDGKLFAAVTIKTKYEPASENAENNAMNQGRRKKGGIHAMYVMEMNPSKAEEGILRTSAPVAVERQLKGFSKRTGTVDYHYIAFNPGGLSNVEVAGIMHHRDAKQLFPTGWNGRYNEKGGASLLERAEKGRDAGRRGAAPPSRS